MKPEQSAPEHLTRASREWWDKLTAEYAFDASARRLLVLACEAFDRCAAARETLDRDGVTYTDRFGAPRARPEVAIERDSRLAFLRLVGALGLTDERPA
jgi:P27 family predicted phage terminase small subunit